MEDDKNKSQDLTFQVSFSDNDDPHNGWVRLVKEETIQIDSPWKRGSLIEVAESPAPAKIPNNSVVMFLEYKVLKFKVSEPQFVEETTEEINENIIPEDVNPSQDDSDNVKSYVFNPEKPDLIQHKVTVLFNEKIVELYSNDEIGKRYIEIAKKDKL